MTVVFDSYVDTRFVFGYRIYNIVLNPTLVSFETKAYVLYRMSQNKMFARGLHNYLQLLVDIFSHRQIYINGFTMKYLT